jgi:hypothetical protein
MTEPTDDIKFSEDEVNEFYERFGGAKFSLQSEVARAYGDHKIDIYFKSVGFAATVIGTIGIIAGFGFTAFGYIQSRLLFFVGEGILLYSILHGLIWVQNIYNGEFRTLDDSQKKHRAYFAERNKLFMEVWNIISTTKKISPEKLTELVEKDKEALQLFAPKNPAVEEKPNPIFSKELYYSMIAGSILLVSSFFIRSLFIFIFCKI